jgi:hypothetical protein
MSYELQIEAPPAPNTYAVYSGKGRGVLCYVRASSESNALAAARTGGLALERTAHAHRVSAQQYAESCRHAGFVVKEGAL